jgi:hypothetical protein
MAFRLAARTLDLTHRSRPTTPFQQLAGRHFGAAWVIPAVCPSVYPSVYCVLKDDVTTPWAQLLTTQQVQHVGLYLMMIDVLKLPQAYSPILLLQRLSSWASPCPQELTPAV